MQELSLDNKKEQMIPFQYAFYEFKFKVHFIVMFKLIYLPEISSNDLYKNSTYTFVQVISS